MSTAALPFAARRTQEARSAETIGRILDAALDCLAEHGWAGTTTTAVATRAGVSRGAQLHHFPTRSSLVGAAVQHLFAGLTAEFEDAFAKLPPGADRVTAAIDLLWAIHQDRRLAAVLELYVAGRTDPELLAALGPVAARHRANVVRLARTHFAEAAAASPAFDSLLDLVLDALQGMTVRRVVYPDESVDPSLALLRRIAAVGLATTRPPEPKD